MDPNAVYRLSAAGVAIGPCWPFRGRQLFWRSGINSTFDGSEQTVFMEMLDEAADVQIPTAGWMRRSWVEEVPAGEGRRDDAGEG